MLYKLTRICSCETLTFIYRLLIFYSHNHNSCSPAELSLNAKIMLGLLCFILKLITTVFLLNKIKMYEITSAENDVKYTFMVLFTLRHTCMHTIAVKLSVLLYLSVLLVTLCYSYC